MLKDRLLELFEEYEEDVRQVIAEVLTLEQEYITRERPRLREQIKQSIERVVRDEA